MNVNYVIKENKKNFIIAKNVKDVQKAIKNSVSIVNFATNAIQEFNPTIIIAPNAICAFKNQLKIYFTVINVKDAYLGIKTTHFIVNFANLVLWVIKKIHIIVIFVKTVISKTNLFIVMIANSALKKNMSPNIWIVSKIDFQDAQLVYRR